MEHSNGFRELIREDQLSFYKELMEKRPDLIVSITYFATLHNYRFGIAGKWNYSKTQVEDFKQRLINIIGTSQWDPPPGTRREPFPWIAFGMTNPLTNKGYREFIEITVLNKELTMEQIREVEKLILEWLY